MRAHNSFVPVFSRLRLWAGLLLYAGLSLNAWSTIDVYEFESDLMRDRYQGLIAELRCPKCQNQNLAGSDSAVAQDLRREVRLLLEEGRSDQEIRQFMRERYGDFILYNPPLDGVTLVLWLIPGIFLLFILIAGVAVIRHAMVRASATNASGSTHPEVGIPPGNSTANQSHAMVQASTTYTSDSTHSGVEILSDNSTANQSGD